MTAMRLPGWIGQRALEGAPCALELCVDDRAVAELRPDDPRADDRDSAVTDPAFAALRERALEALREGSR